MIRDLGETPEGRVYELFGIKDANVLSPTAETSVDLPSDPDNPAHPFRVTVLPREHADVTPFELDIQDGRRSWRTRERGVIVRALWKARFFEWPKDIDPRQKLDEWRALAADIPAVELRSLRLPFGHRGPRADNLSIPADAQAALPDAADHFAMIATTSLRLPAGRWKVRTLSDDGIRVTADAKPIIDNWTWHGPTVNEGMLELDRERTVELAVEYFEIDGYAVLELTLERVAD
jgi:hypothetical protein